MGCTQAKADASSAYNRDSVGERRASRGSQQRVSGIKVSIADGNGAERVSTAVATGCGHGSPDTPNVPPRGRTSNAASVRSSVAGRASMRSSVADSDAMSRAGSQTANIFDNGFVDELDEELAAQQVRNLRKKRMSMHLVEPPPAGEAAGAGASQAAQDFHRARRSIEVRRTSLGAAPEMTKALAAAAAAAGDRPENGNDVDKLRVKRKSVAIVAEGSDVGVAPSQAAKEYYSARKSLSEPRVSSAQAAKLALELGEPPAQEDVSTSKEQPVTGDGSNLDAEIAQRAMLLSAVPLALRRPLLMLAALPANTPVPTAVLSRLWARVLDGADVVATVDGLEECGLVLSAQPTEYSVWVLVTPEVQEHLQAVAGDMLPELHNFLLEMYVEEGCTVADVPDDGYFMHNVTFHLSESGNLADHKALLSDPFWLEEKLHSYGVASTVVDFRRFLLQSPDPEVRLFLQAFQMSVGCCLSHIDACVLPAQMIGRLLSMQGQYPGIARWVKEVKHAIARGKYNGRRTGANAQPGTKRQRYLRKRPAAGNGAAGTDAAVAVAAAARSSNETGRKTSVEAAGEAASTRSSAGDRRNSVESNGEDEPVEALVPETLTLEQVGRGARLALRGHTDELTCMALSPDAMDLVTCSADGSTCVWDMEIGDCVLLLEGASAVTCVGLSLNAGLILTGTATGCINVWDLEGGVCKKVLKPHRTAIRCLKVATNGSIVVSGAANGSVGVWALASDKIMHHMTGHTGEVLCMDALFSVDWTDDHCQTITGAADFTARLWNLRFGNCRAVFEGHTGWVTAVGLNGVGDLAVTGSQDHSARTWDCRTGQCVAVLEGHLGPVSSLSVNGDLVATVSEDQTARIWRIADGAALQVLSDHAGWLNTVSFAGSTVVTGGSDCSVSVWGAGSGALEAVLEGHSGEVVQSLMSEDAMVAVTAGGDNTARVWDLQAAVREYSRMGMGNRHSGSVTRLAVCLNGSRVVTAGEDGQALVWRTSDYSCAGMLGGTAGHRASIKWLVNLAGFKEVVTVSGDRMVCAWDLAATEAAEEGDAAVFAPVRCMPPVAGSRVKSFACSGDGRLGAVVLFDSSLSIWDLRSGERLKVLQQRGDRDKEFVHSGGINGVLLSRDGKLVLTYSKDWTARVWDTDAGRCSAVLEGHAEDVVSAALAADGRWALTGSYDGSARVWDLTSGGTCTAVLEDHPREVHAVELSPDGATTVTLSGQTAKVWETGTGSLLHSLSAGVEESSSLVQGAAFDSEGSRLITTTEERMNLWDLKTGNLLFVFVADCAITCAAFAGPPVRANLVVCGDVNGNVHFLPLPQSGPRRSVEKGSAGNGVRRSVEKSAASAIARRSVEKGPHAAPPRGSLESSAPAQPSRLKLTKSAEVSPFSLADAAPVISGSPHLAAPLSAPKAPTAASLPPKTKSPPRPNEAKEECHGKEKGKEAEVKDGEEDEFFSNFSAKDI